MGSTVILRTKLDLRGKSLITGGPFLLSVVSPPPALNFFTLENARLVSMDRGLLKEFHRMQNDAKERMAACWRGAIARLKAALFQGLFADHRAPSTPGSSTIRAWLALAGIGMLTGAWFAAANWLQV
jgi:hypothetical protein